MAEQLLRFDIQLFQLINSWHGTAADMLFLVLTKLGNGWVVAPLLLAAILARVPRQRATWVILVCAVGMTASGLVNSAVKKAVRRERPLAYFMSHPVAHGAPFTVHVVGDSLRARSFPSGHTNTAFSAATVVVLLFGPSQVWTFAVAGAVGYSRCYLGGHYPLDVVAGGMLGVAVTFVFVYPGLRLVRRREERAHASLSHPPIS